MFSGLSDRFHGIFEKFSVEKTFTEDNIKDAAREVRLALPASHLRTRHTAQLAIFLVIHSRKQLPVGTY